tara:strand:+ start:23600 stop:25300 length:1701 start_codon:yes stop_codon:yes gene_type:complete
MFNFDYPVKAVPESFREFLPTLTTPAIHELHTEFHEGVVRMREFHKQLLGDEGVKTLLKFSEGVEIYHNSKHKKSKWEGDLIEMFDLDRSINARAEKFWFKLFDLVGLSNILPKPIWEKWKESFESWRFSNLTPLPPFTSEVIYSCLNTIEAQRANFMALRVQSLWDGLSGWHKTNVGSAFHKRFILDNMYSDSGSTNDKDRTFVDLLNVASTILTGTDDPFTNAHVELARARKNHCGEWVEVMDGAIRIKAFKRGTLHVEVHPDIANRLNIALAYIYPNALADELTLKKPRNKSGFGSGKLYRQKIAYSVRSYLKSCTQKQNKEGLWVIRDPVSHIKIHGALRQLITEVILQIGGQAEMGGYLFDYWPGDVIADILKTGTVPQKVSYQFYPTPNDLALEFVSWVGVSDSGRYYESSAGTAGIAKHMPLQTHCIEIDSLRCMALDQMGFEVTKGDFLKLLPADVDGLVDGVLMNPPFEGRAWQNHFEHAVQFVRQNGVIGAILPMGAIRKMPEIAGRKVIYSEVMKGRFPGTSIDVVFAKWVKSSVHSSSEEDQVPHATQDDLFAA